MSGHKGEVAAHTVDMTARAVVPIARAVVLSVLPRRALAWCAAVLVAVCALLLVPSGAASAHPLGNFTVNRYDGLVAGPGLLRIDHIEDLAEIPATQAQPRIERLGMTDWARERCATAARDSRVTVDGRRIAVSVGAARAQVRPGQAGLHTLRLVCRLGAPLPEGRTVSVAFRSAGPDSGPGWREITARGDRMTLTAHDVPATSVSHELTRYPGELLSSPADTATATLRARPGGPALPSAGRDTADHDAPGSAVLPRGVDHWTQAFGSLVARRDLTLGFAALALTIAVALGALHALAPGHGKTLMAAMAAARGGATVRDVLPLAASVTVTHTLGVVALGLLIAAGSTAATSVTAWLGFASGLLVTVAGAALVRRAWRNRGGGHPHARGDGHVKDHAHAHDHAQAHAHHHPHEHAHGSAHTHTQGGHPHTHPTAPTLRGTILLGFAGGLVPSPSAVVVLVGASALGQAWFGVLLVVGYGAGLALSLAAAGFVVVRVGGRVTEALRGRPRSGPGRSAALISRAAPLGSACVVLALGAGLVARGAAAVLG